MWGQKVVAGEVGRAWEVLVREVLGQVEERRQVVLVMALRRQVVQAALAEEWEISPRQVLALALGGAQRRHSPLVERPPPVREREMRQVKERPLPQVQAQEELVKAPGPPQVSARQHTTH